MRGGGARIGSVWQGSAWLGEDLGELEAAEKFAIVSPLHDEYVSFDSEWPLGMGRSGEMKRE